MGLVCPHCHNALDVGERSATAEIVCPACGSSFRVEPTATTDWAGPENRRKLGKYELIDSVGTGAFGTVYKARDPDLDRLVAVKVPRAGELAGKGELERFLREARSVAQLRHPFIVSVHDVGEWRAEGVNASVPYLVSEFVYGMTLADQLSARPPAPREAAQLIARLAEALHYAHEMGVVHRDVKPSNVMLSDDGTPRLMDFGLAKRDAGDVTVTVAGQVLGTPAYMSPEQARGEGHSVDGRSDVYSLGVILYHLLTGELPFRGTPRMLLHQVLHDEPPRPRSLNNKIPKDLETVCLKAMAKETARRYQTARELADDLGRFLKGEPIQARPLSAWERGWRWARRRPAVAALLLVSAIAALALASAVVALHFNARLEEKNVQLANAFDATDQARQAAEAQRQRTEEALNDARYYQYFHHIALAHAGWREANLVGVDKLLDDCPRSQRNWEWHYLQRLCHAHSIILRGEDPVLGLAFSPDGTRLACGSFDGIVRVLDAATKKEVSILRAHLHEIADVAFSPDGRQVASSCFDGTIKVWEVATGRELFTCQGHKKVVWQVAFSPDGTRLASAGNDRTIRLWDARTGAAIPPVLDHPGEVWGIAFGRNGSQVVSGGPDKFVRLWDMTTGQVVRTFARGAANSAYCPVAFSPNGELLASADTNGNVQVWDVATGLTKQRFRGHRGVLWSVTFSPNGRWLASSGIDQTVRVWDVVSGQPLQTLKGHTMEVCRVAFHPDGSWLASASSDGTVRAWPATADQEARIFQVRGSREGSLAYTPDGTRLASTAGGSTVTIWDAATGQVIHTLAYQPLGPATPAGLLGVPVAYSPDGRRIAAGAADGTVPIWDAHTEQFLQQRRLHTSGVAALAYGRDGNLASAGEDGTVMVWGPATGQVVHELRGHKAPVNGLAFNPDGSRLASASDDNTAMIWDATTGKLLHTLRGHTSWVMGVAFSRDGKRLATGGNDNCAIVWEPATGRQVRKLLHASLVALAMFSPDGQRLFTCSDDGTIKVWEVETGLETLSLRGHTSVVRGLSLSPDGTHLASSSDDGTIRTWDARTWTAEAAAEASSEREALGLLDFLFAMPLRKDDVREHLRTATGITSQARQIALGLMKRYREETDPERYYRASWAIVRQPHLNPFQYRFALRQAETACSLARGQCQYRTTLGIAHYRNGQYAKALAILTQAEQSHRAAAARLTLAPAAGLLALTGLWQADQLRQTIPANLAFLTMAHHRLGQAEPARAALVRLRQTMKLSPWLEDREAQGFLREAEEQIEPQRHIEQENKHGCLGTKKAEWQVLFTDPFRRANT